MDTAGYNLQFKNMQIRHNIFKEYQIKFLESTVDLFEMHYIYVWLLVLENQDRPI